MHRPTPRALERAARPLSILLAEDHDEFRELLVRRLEADGALVDCVADGQLAMARLLEARFRPDVVISDVSMPVKTGVDILRAVRCAGLTIPVILLTGFGRSVEHAAAEIEALGGAVVIEKPFDFDDLRTVLRNLPVMARLPPR